MLKSGESADRGASAPSDLYLTSPPIHSPNVVKSQKTLDEEHVESRILCMASLQARDRPAPLVIRMSLEGHPQSLFGRDITTHQAVYASPRK